MKVYSLHPVTTAQFTALAAAVTGAENDITALQSDTSDLTKAACGRAFFAPGATPTRNVFDTFEDAAAALATFGGGDLVIDTRGGAASTAGVFVDLTGIRIVGLNGTTPELDVVEGTVFATDYNQIDIINVIIKWLGTTAPFQLDGANLSVTLGDYAQIDTTAADGGFFALTNTSNLYIDVGYFCQLTGGAGFPVVQINDSGSGCEVQMLTASVLAANTLAGGGDGVYLITDMTAGLTAGGGKATISHTQSAATNPVFAP